MITLRPMFRYEASRGFLRTGSLSINVNIKTVSIQHEQLKKLVNVPFRLFRDRVTQYRYSIMFPFRDRLLISVQVRWLVVSVPKVPISNRSHPSSIQGHGFHFEVRSFRKFQFTVLLTRPLFLLEVQNT
jgi:hypothetical protein